MRTGRAGFGSCGRIRNAIVCRAPRRFPAIASARIRESCGRFENAPRIRADFNGPWRVRLRALRSNTIRNTADARSERRTGNWTAAVGHVRTEGSQHAQMTGLSAYPCFLQFLRGALGLPRLRGESPLGWSSERANPRWSRSGSSMHATNRGASRGSLCGARALHVSTRAQAATLSPPP